MQKTVEQVTKNTMATFEAKVTTMVADLLAAQSGTIITQVATLMSGANSPFVTAESLHQVMEKFIDSVNTRIDTLTNSPYKINPDGSPVRVRKQSKTQDSTEYDPMDTQPTHDKPFNAATKTVDGAHH
jgi:hypothetical protein